MNDRYNRTFRNKYVYYLTEAATVIGVSIINLFHSGVLNLIAWVTAVLIISYVLYYEDSDHVLRRIVECEVLFFYIGVCETLGVKICTTMDFIII